MNVLRITIILCAFAAALTTAQEEYEYEDENAAPQQPQRGRTPLAASRQTRLSPLAASKPNRLPQSPGKNSKGQPPVQSSPPPPPPDQGQEEAPAEYEDEPQEAGGDGASEAASTEPPKRTIKPVVRPFRSNDDLLAALKRRRQQAQNTGTVVDKSSTASTTTTEAHASKNKHSSFGSNKGRSRNAASPGLSKQSSPAPAEAPSEPETPKRVTATRGKFNSRNTARVSSTQAPEEEEDKSELTAAKPKFGRGSRRS